VSARPLDGIRVLDLSRLLPGGYATLILAELGADVLKVEQPGRGDYIRAWAPRPASGDSALHHALNRGKRSVTLDLSHSAGAELFRELVASADVLVESFRPGVMDRLGLGYATLHEQNPGLVYAAISGYGATGGRAGVAGHDIDYLALAGVLGLAGPVRGGPWQPPVQVADLGGGALPAVIAILAALRVRDATGAGQFCDVSMTDGVRSWLLLAVAGYAATGLLPRASTDPLAGGLACYRVYACADGRHVAVGALESAFFARLLDVLDLSELAPAHLDPTRQDELASRLGAAFATRTRDEWAAAFADVDACVTPVLDLAEALADPVARERGTITQTTLPDGTPFPGLATMPALSDTPACVGGPAPALGEHSEQVLAELGRTPAQIADLRARGVT
jgi:alpha-methylacyl-CoA racemase